MRRRTLLLACVLTLASCSRDKSRAAAGSADAAAAVNLDLDSKDILARTEVAERVDVKHVLIGWTELKEAYKGHIDPRAEKRSQAEAAKLAAEVADKLRKDPAKLDELIKQHSEDPGSVAGKVYTVDANARYVPEFKQLALRLKPGEVGIVRTMYGYHVMIRPLPDPLESADILARAPQDGTIWVQHILIGWKDAPAAKKRAPDPRAAARTKQDADKVVKEVLDKLAGGGDMTALMKEYSEDPGSKDTGKSYEVTARAQLVEPFKNLAMRLQMGEVGVVMSVFGWHVMKRVEPPPPDPLESADILAREPVTQSAKVKHILLGWNEVNAGDDRGKNRTRAELETLVKATMARLKKGEKIEELMKELSEDPGSATAGNSYDVSPTARLVEPFKALSLRLKVGEIGAVKTEFGIHIIQRVE